MQKTSTIMLLTCVLWYAATSTMNTFAIIAAFIVTLTVLPYWAFVTAAKTGRQPGKWLLISIVLPLIGPLILALKARSDIARVAAQEKQAGKKGYFERKFGTWGTLIPYVAVLLAALIIFAVSRSGSGTPLASTGMPYTGPVRNVDTTNGNETANIVNGGMLMSTAYNELFTNLDDGGRIYSVSIQEGNKLRPFSEDSGSNFCAFSDYVYYINKSDHDRIYKMNMKDANRKEKITDAPVSQFCINEMIYYINKNDHDRIYRIDNEGKNNVRLGTKRATNLFQLYGNLYYLNLDDGGKIYQMTSEGKRSRKIVKDRAGEMFYARGRLYYINLDDNYRIYSVTDKEEERRKESNDGADCISFNGFAIFYSNRNDEGRIYKLDMENGAAPVRLNEDTNCKDINDYSGDLMYISNGEQKFVNDFNGAPSEKFYPGTNSSQGQVETIQVPEPPSLPDIAASLGISPLPGFNSQQPVPSAPESSSGQVPLPPSETFPNQVPPPLTGAPPEQVPPPPTGNGSSTLTPEQEAQIFKTQQQFADYVFPDGAAYNGDMKDGLPDGRGSAIYANGDTFAGNWKAGKREGYGGLNMAADKSFYMGEWKDDKKNGRGILQKDGKSTEGIWKDNEYVGPVPD